MKRSNWFYFGVAIFRNRRPAWGVCRHRFWSITASIALAVIAQHRESEILRHTVPAVLLTKSTASRLICTTSHFWQFAGA